MKKLAPMSIQQKKKCRCKITVLKIHLKLHQNKTQTGASGKCKSEKSNEAGINQALTKDQGLN